MYKQSPSRFHRSKGVKGKHILQFCVLFVVSFWLIYQVKHSYDKQKELEVKDGKILEEIRTDGEIQRLGRKDLPRDNTEEDKEPGEEKSKHSEHQPAREEGIVSRGDEDSELNEKEADTEGGSEESHTKNEDNEGASEENHDANEEHNEGSEDNRSENEENAGDSEENITENEEHDGESEENPAENEENEGQSEESNTENEEHEEGSEENHTENEEDENAGKGDLTESEQNEGDGKGGASQSDNTSEDQDHDGGTTSTTHEAQEELYKGDDASSEVAHNVQTIIPETVKVTTGHGNELWGNIDISRANETRTSNKDNAGETPRENKVNNSGTLSNATVTEEKKYGSNSDELENSSPPNSTLLSLPEDQPENSSNPTTVNGQNRVILLSHKTQHAASSNKTQNVNTDNGESLSFSDTTSSSSHEKNGTGTMSAGEDSSLNQEKKSEKNGKEVSDETSEYQPSDDGTDAFQHDPIDASDTELDTLPEIRTEVQKTDDTGAE